ncbi:hypothetical protein BG004_004059 [Podila humilis]|nr:hypothetical protein BG004_004059 [Podila humilis]
MSCKYHRESDQEHDPLLHMIRLARNDNHFTQLVLEVILFEFASCTQRYKPKTVYTFKQIMVAWDMARMTLSKFEKAIARSPAYLKHTGEIESDLGNADEMSTFELQLTTAPFMASPHHMANFFLDPFYRPLLLPENLITPTFPSSNKVAFSPGTRTVYDSFTFRAMNNHDRDHFFSVYAANVDYKLMDRLAAIVAGLRHVWKDRGAGGESFDLEKVNAIQVVSIYARQRFVNMFAKCSKRIKPEHDGTVSMPLMFYDDKLDDDARMKADLNAAFSGMMETALGRMVEDAASKEEETSSQSPKKSTSTTTVTSTKASASASTAAKSSGTSYSMDDSTITPLNNKPSTVHSMEKKKNAFGARKAEVESKVIAESTTIPANASPTVSASTKASMASSVKASSPVTRSSSSSTVSTMDKTDKSSVAKADNSSNAKTDKSSVAPSPYVVSPAARKAAEAVTRELEKHQHQPLSLQDMQYLVDPNPLLRQSITILTADQRAFVVSCIEDIDAANKRMHRTRKIMNDKMRSGIFSDFPMGDREMRQFSHDQVTNTIMISEIHNLSHGAREKAWVMVREKYKTYAASQKCKDYTSGTALGYTAEDLFLEYKAIKGQNEAAAAAINASKNAKPAAKPVTPVSAAKPPAEATKKTVTAASIDTDSDLPDLLSSDDSSTDSDLPDLLSDSETDLKKGVKKDETDDDKDDLDFAPSDSGDSGDSDTGSGAESTDNASDEEDSVCGDAEENIGMYMLVSKQEHDSEAWTRKIMDQYIDKHNATLLDVDREEKIAREQELAYLYSCTWDHDQIFNSSDLDGSDVDGHYRPSDADDESDGLSTEYSDDNDIDTAVSDSELADITAGKEATWVDELKESWLQEYLMEARKRNEAAEWTKHYNLRSRDPVAAEAIEKEARERRKEKTVQDRHFERVGRKVKEELLREKELRDKQEAREKLEREQQEARELVAQRWKENIEAAQAERAAEEQRQREEKEAARLADEKRLKEEAVARLAEDKRKKEEAARLVEEKRKKEEAARLAEDKRLRQEAAKLAAEQRLKMEKEHALRVRAEQERLFEQNEAMARKLYPELCRELDARKQEERKLASPGGASNNTTTAKIANLFSNLGSRPSSSPASPSRSMPASTTPTGSPTKPAPKPAVKPAAKPATKSAAKPAAKTAPGKPVVTKTSHTARNHKTVVPTSFSVPSTYTHGKNNAEWNLLEARNMRGPTMDPAVHEALVQAHEEYDSHMECPVYSQMSMQPEIHFLLSTGGKFELKDENRVYRHVTGERTRAYYLRKQGLVTMLKVALCKTEAEARRFQQQARNGGVTDWGDYPDDDDDEDHSYGNDVDDDDDVELHDAAAVASQVEAILGKDLINDLEKMFVQALTGKEDDSEAEQSNSVAKQLAATTFAGYKAAAIPGNAAPPPGHKKVPVVLPKKGQPVVQQQQKHQSEDNDEEYDSDDDGFYTDDDDYDDEDDDDEDDDDDEMEGTFDELLRSGLQGLLHKMTAEAAATVTAEKKTAAKKSQQQSTNGGAKITALPTLDESTVWPTGGQMFYNVRGIDFSLGLWMPPTNREFMDMEKEVLEWYPLLIASTEELSMRHDLVKRLQDLFNSKFPGKGLTVRPFGSYLTGLGDNNSDVDMCIYSEQFQPHAPHSDVSVLASWLEHECMMHNVQAITDAKVPIVKFVDTATGIACDLNVQHPLGIANSTMIKQYIDIDDRLSMFLMLLKYFAKCHGILDASQGYLCSYALILMGIVFFQEQEKPILPRLQSKSSLPTGITIRQHSHKKKTLSAALADGSVKPRWEFQAGQRFDCTFDTRASQYKKFGKNNKKTVGQLLYEFFEFFSRKFDYRTMEVNSQLGQFRERSAVTRQKKAQLASERDSGYKTGHTADSTGCVFDVDRNVWVNREEQNYIYQQEMQGIVPHLGRSYALDMLTKQYGNNNNNNGNSSSNSSSIRNGVATLGADTAAGAGVSVGAGGRYQDRFGTEPFLCVMDPFITNRNVAGTCRGKKLTKVWKCFDHAYKCLAVGDMNEAFCTPAELLAEDDEEEDVDDGE